MLLRLKQAVVPFASLHSVSLVPQTEPHCPPLQIFPVPQPVLSSLLSQPTPLAAHLRQPPPPSHFAVQQTLPTQKLVVQSAALRQAPPGGVLGFCGSAQVTPVASEVQTFGDAQATGRVSQTPPPVQRRSFTVPVPPQVEDPQVVFAASRRQPPLPLQELLHASSLQVPLGSAPPTPTLLHVPCLPGNAHDLQTPLQVVAQQNPWAQMPLWQALPDVHLFPSSTLPQEPPLQTLPLTH